MICEYVRTLILDRDGGIGTSLSKASHDGSVDTSPRQWMDGQRECTVCGMGAPPMPGTLLSSSMDRPCTLPKCCDLWKRLWPTCAHQQIATFKTREKQKLKLSYTKVLSLKKISSNLIKIYKIYIFGLKKGLTKTVGKFVP